MSWASTHKPLCQHYSSRPNSTHLPPLITKLFFSKMIFATHLICNLLAREQRDSPVIWASHSHPLYLGFDPWQIPPHTCAGNYFARVCMQLSFQLMLEFDSMSVRSLRALTNPKLHYPKLRAEPIW